jgi:hypothetical protein
MNIDINCKVCGRDLGKAYGTVIAEIICRNTSCKAGNQIKIINADSEADIKHKFMTPARPPKKKEVEVS